MTTQEIDKTTALKISKGWEVVSASDISYFDCGYWKRRTVKAEKVDDKNKIIFTLFNGDFVELEK